MKINKILAAGIAATLAVTSLAAVAVPASAESKTFDMAKTIGTEKVSFTGAWFKDNNTIAVTKDADGNITTPMTAGVNYIKVDSFRDGDGAIKNWKVTGVQIKVTGTRNGATNTVTETYDAKKIAEGTFEAKLANGIVNEVGAFNLNAYDAVTGMEVLVTMERSVLEEGAQAWGVWRANGVADDDGGLDENGNKNEWRCEIKYKKGNDGAYAFGGTYAGDTNVDKIFKNLGTSEFYGGPGGVWVDRSGIETKDMLAFLEKTTDSTTIKRQDVKLLSEAGAHNAETHHILGQDQDGNQTFTDGHIGTAPYWFGGLASWVADFFNKQNNGKITFNFTANASSSSSWKNGGIPSTEVGLKSAVAGTTMGLFVNYQQSTGSLQSLGQAEGTSITFDISEILNDMGGLTKGNVSDIYYGMNDGINYKNKDYGSVHAAKDQKAIDDNAKNGTDFWYVSTEDANDGHKCAIGYLVESVTLSYDEAAAAADADADVDDEDDTDVTDDADDEEEDDVAADDADDDEEDEDDDAELTDDTDDDDDVANDEDINTPADDDANPGTGVALAVIPAIVAAAAAVVSKKRK